MAARPPTDPEATVVIPTRDRWSLLQVTLQSVLAQEGVGLEVIVVDDGSVDETPLRLAEMDDERLRVLRHQAGRGVAAARNAAIASARGDWLAFLDDDDLWAPHKLRAQLTAARERGATWAYSAALVVDERWSVLDEIEAPDPDELIGLLLSYNPLPAGASNVVARTAVVRELGGYDESLSHFADWDLWIRLTSTGAAAACREPLVAYVQHPGSMVLSDREGVASEFERLAHKHLGLSAEQGVEFDRAGLVRWLAWADSRAGRPPSAARGYLRASAMYARTGNFWMSRASLRDAAGALFGQILTDTGRRRVHAADERVPSWLAAHARTAPPSPPNALMRGRRLRRLAGHRHGASHLTGLRERLDAALSSCVPAGATVALLDFPAFSNVGDSAIWLGTLAALQRLQCSIAYVCDQDSYAPDILERRLPAGSPVLLQGGGNFGDLWEGHQLFRERVITDFPHRPIVQLPVSIAFTSAAAEERARAILNGHERVTVMCRDPASLRYVEEHYEAEVMLCPDGALGLSPRRRPRPATDVVMLKRNDQEAVTRMPPLPGAVLIEWSSEPGDLGYSSWWDRKMRLSRRLAAPCARGEGVAQVATERLLRSMARQRLAFGYDVVSSGRVLVTDRLHGHILALLLGVPHVILETGYGKIRGFYEAFSRGLPGVTLCENPDDLEALVQSVLAEERGR